MTLEPEVRERLRLALEAGAPAPGAACADPDDLWRAVRGELAAPRAAELLGHAAACPHCALALRLAREIAADAPADASGDGPPARIVPLRARWPILALAAAACALLALPLLRPAGPPLPTTAALRGAADTDLRPLLPEGPLPRRGALLRWSAAGEGARYAVAVATRDLTPLWSASGLTATEVAVPEAALASLPPGSEVLWTVEARLPDGRRLSPPAFVARVE